MAVDQSSFDAWLGELQTIMWAWDKKHGNLPYALPLRSEENEANVLCWKDSFDDGMTPQEAFDSDQSYWEA